MIKHKSTPPHNSIIICVVLCIVLSTTPVTASVQDNLNLVISKLIGQKNETTTQAAYSNASTNAKLNYLEGKVRSIESTLSTMSTSSGSVPKCTESGTFTEKTFTGPGVLYINPDYPNFTLVVDGVSCKPWNFIVFNNGSVGRSVCIIPFKNSVSVSGTSVQYVLYKY